jgi:hypothetical protein
MYVKIYIFGVDLGRSQGGGGINFRKQAVNERITGDCYHNMNRGIQQEQENKAG